MNMHRIYVSVYGCAYRCAFGVHLVTRLTIPRATAAAACDNAPRLIYGCLAPGSTISDCVPRCVPVSHTHTHTITQRGPCSWWQAASLRLLPACTTHSSLSSSYLHWFPPLPPNLDMHSLKTGQLQSTGPEKAEHFSRLVVVSANYRHYGI